MSGQNRSELAKIVTVIGARPQFVKAGPVSAAVARRGEVTEIIVDTGQHYDASLVASNIAALGMEQPDIVLGISGGNPPSMIGRMLVHLESLLLDLRPDAVLVYGDTNSTLAGALTSAHLDMPVVHVEAGVRSRNMGMPEERNRVIVDRISTIRLAPTRTALDNLQSEGLAPGSSIVGDVMLDAFLLHAPDERSSLALLGARGIEAGEYCLATIHRTESTGDRESLGERLAFIERQAVGMPVLLPMHPRLREAVERFGLPLDRFTVLDPLPYDEFSALVKGARRVFTDSGGVQKEALFHGTQCVTLRQETEWPETLLHGWNTLWTETVPERPTAPAPREAFGDGRAADRVVDAVLRLVTDE